jgi:hypothetical protein
VGENRHGDVAWLVDVAGDVTDSHVWDPFGVSAGATGSSATSVGFQVGFLSALRDVSASPSATVRRRLEEEGDWRITSALNEWHPLASDA